MLLFLSDFTHGNGFFHGFSVDTIGFTMKKWRFFATNGDFTGDLPLMEHEGFASVVFSKKRAEFCHEEHEEWFIDDEKWCCCHEKA